MISCCGFATTFQIQVELSLSLVTMFGQIKILLGVIVNDPFPVNSLEEGVVTSDSTATNAAPGGSRLLRMMSKALPGISFSHLVAKRSWARPWVCASSG